MYCIYCGAKQSDNNKFCIKCGREIKKVREEEEEKHRAPPHRGRKKKRRKHTGLLIAILSAVLLLSIGFFVIRMLDAKHSEAANTLDVNTSEAKDGEGWNSPSPSIEPESAGGTLSENPSDMTHQMDSSTPTPNTQNGSQFIVDHSNGQNQDNGVYDNAEAVSLGNLSGLWENDTTSYHTILIYNQNDRTISIQVSSIKPSSDGVGELAFDITTIEDIPINNGQGSKEYTDSFGNYGIIHLSFSSNSLNVNYEVIQRDDLANWGIDPGAGTYHWKSRVVTASEERTLMDNTYYAYILGFGGMSTEFFPILASIQECFIVDNDTVSSLSEGDVIFADGSAYMVEDLSERETGRCYLEIGYMLVKYQNRGVWVFCAPSLAKVLREVEITELKVSSDVTIQFDPILIQIYGEGIQNLPLDELLFVKDDFHYVLCRLTMESGIVTAMKFEYTP